MMANKVTNEESVTVVKELKDLRFEDIKSVYSGKAGHCCCGCAGKHYRPNAMRGTVIPGLEFQDTRYGKDDCSDAMIRKVLRILQASSEKIEFGTNHFALVVGSRIYIAYTE